MATTKSKKSTSRKTTKSSTKTASTKPKAAAAKSTAKPVAKPVEKPAVVPAEPQTSANPFKGFFERKFDASENILTIFKSPRIYGAILGEVIGTMLLTLIFLTLGVYQPLYILFGVIAVSAAVFAFSGANLNPIVTVGMMATRRMSAIRGVVYMLSQVLGAWLAFLLASAFVNNAGDAALAELPKMSEVAPESFWMVTMLEFVGSIILAFFYARAHAYKRSTLTFAFMYGTGVCVAMLFVIVVSSSFVGLQNNFMLNPAAALMYQILPTGGESFGEVLGDVCLALVTYAILPMVGGFIGFVISDVAARLSGEKVCCCGSAECAAKKVIAKK
ncbi:aquaporin [Candidatus Saccharibacteria bacterium]|nr:aquaporin [Candidatus Saccharibacteria bacterium]